MYRHRSAKFQLESPRVSRRSILGSLVASIALPCFASAQTAVPAKIFDPLALYGQLLVEADKEKIQPKGGLRIFQDASGLSGTGLSQDYVDRLLQLNWSYSAVAELARADENNASGLGVDTSAVLRLDTFASADDARDYLDLTRSAWERDDITLLTDDDHGVGGLNVYTLTSPLSNGVDSSYVNASLIVNRTTVMTFLVVGYDNPIDSAWAIDATVAAKKAKGVSTANPIGRNLRFPEGLGEIEIRLPVAGGSLIPEYGSTPEQRESATAFAGDAVHQYTSAVQFSDTDGQPYLIYQTGSSFASSKAAAGYFDQFQDVLDDADRRAGNVSRYFESDAERPPELDDDEGYSRDWFLYDLGNDTLFGGAEIVSLAGNFVWTSAIFTNFDVDVPTPTGEAWSTSSHGVGLMDAVEEYFAVSRSEMSSGFGSTFAIKQFADDLAAAD
jgi:hypothetical protein